MPRKPHTTSQVQLLRERYYKALPGKESLIQIIGEAEVSEQVYNSNAIENSTLTLEETEKILLQIDLDSYISEREIFEAKNLARVVLYINTKAKEQEFTIDRILLLHKMLMGNIREEIAGRFRKDGEWVRVGSYIAVDPQKITERLENMFAKYQATSPAHIIKRIAELHLTFEYIHPFVDGNGRIGRVINNYFLIREGFVPINIKFIDRKQYHEGKKIVSLKEFATVKKMSHSNAINKANRQTLEAFLEKDEWKIGL